MLEHPQILVFVRDPGMNPPWIPRVVKFWGSPELYMDFQLHGGVNVLNPCVVQGSIQRNEGGELNPPLFTSILTAFPLTFMS